MAVAFLCTRVKQPDTDDYKTLTKVMQYLKDMTLTIEPGDEPKWWVDSSYVPRHEKPHKNIHDTRKRSYLHSLM